MNETLAWVFAWGAGVVLGGSFCFGLSWTMRKGGSFERPALWFAGSMILRASFVLGALYLASGRSAARMLVGALGIVMAHRAATWLETRRARAELARTEVERSLRALPARNGVPGL